MKTDLQMAIQDLKDNVLGRGCISEYSENSLETLITAATHPQAPKRDGGEYQAYHRIMTLLRNLEMRHGKCEPREDRACTHCNAKDDIKKLVSEYKGAPIYASEATPPTIGRTPAGG